MTFAASPFGSHPFAAPLTGDAPTPPAPGAIAHPRLVVRTATGSSIGPRARAVPSPAATPFHSSRSPSPSFLPRRP